jgi:hypothetical protein
LSTAVSLRIADLLLSTIKLYFLLSSSSSA